MISRFQGNEGKNRLIVALREQTIVHGSEEIASAIVDKVDLRQVEAGTEIIRVRLF